MNRTNRVSEMHSYREKVDWKAILNLGSEVPDSPSLSRLITNPNPVLKIGRGRQRGKFVQR